MDFVTNNFNYPFKIISDDGWLQGIHLGIILVDVEEERDVLQARVSLIKSDVSGTTYFISEGDCLKGQNSPQVGVRFPLVCNMTGSPGSQRKVEGVFEVVEVTDVR